MVAKSCSLLIAMLVSFGCSADSAAQRDDDPVTPVVAVAPAPATNNDEPDEPDHLSCVAPCLQLGQCANVDGSCVALDDGHCEKSRACRENGLCSAVDGACVRPPLPTVPECDAFIQAVTRCHQLPGAGDAIQHALQQALTAMVDSSNTAEEGRAKMAEACKTLLVGLSQAPCP